MNIQELAEEASIEFYGGLPAFHYNGNDPFVAGYVKAMQVQSSTRITPVGIVEEMAGVLYSNKSDESDEGSWIVAEDYYKIASLCAAIAQKHIQEDSVAFAEWATNEGFFYNGSKWERQWKINRPYINCTTPQLYAIYQQSK